MDRIRGKYGSGSITFEGRNLLGMKAHKLVSQGMALCPEGRRIFQLMTVRENLEMGGYSRPPQEIEARWRTCSAASRASRSAKSRSRAP